MKLLAGLILFVMTSTSIQAQSAADQILGIYWTPRKDGKMQVFKSGDRYFGKLVWGKNSRLDEKNPNPAERTKQLLGMVILKNFLFKEGKYSDGQIYDPDSGKTYDCTMWLEGLKLKVRGYVGVSLFGRTETFERVE
jgi:uncharacterized protein (DUF2147 family)